MPPKATAAASGSGSGPSTTTPAPPKLQQSDVPAAFQRFRTDLQNLAQKISELESELEEHALVLSTLRPLLSTEPTRKCYRQIAGVLVERTVADVVPALETNHAGIKEVLEGLARTYKAREDEFGRFQREYGIQMGGNAPTQVRA